MHDHLCVGADKFLCMGKRPCNGLYLAILFSVTEFLS